MEPENTPTPHDITSAEKVVAELLSGADGWEIAVDHEIRLYGEGTEDAIGMQARADMYRRAATLIESQRATIERDRAAVFDAMGDAVRFMDPPDGGDPTQAEMVANMRRQLEAAEARVTALEAEKAGAGWQDISTAPKDGTPILMGFPPEGEKPGAVFDGWWDRESGGWVDGDTDNYDDLRVYHHITHWQPLPAPPQALSRSSTEVKNDG